MLELSLIPATVAASYVHGGDHTSKGVLMAIMAALALVSLYPSIGPWAFAAMLLSPFYWFLFRTGKQAGAELDYMYRTDNGSLGRIALSYALPFGITTIIVCGFAGFKGEWHNMLWLIPCLLSIGPVLWAAKKYRQDKGESERKNRSYVELANGLLGGVHLTAIAWGL